MAVLGRAIICSVAILLYFVILVRAQCDENMPPLELSDLSGSFDFPSRTPAGNYLNSMRCWWHIRCPAGRSIGLLQHIATPKTGDGDYWDYFDVDKTETVHPRVLGEDVRLEYLFHTNEILVHFHANSDGVVAKGLIEPATYTCHAHRCHTNTAYGAHLPVTNTIANGPLSKISTLYNNEWCSWRVFCNAATEYLYVFRPILVRPGAMLSAIDNLGRNLTNLQELQYMPDVHTITIDFISNAAERHFLLDFGCQVKIPDSKEGCRPLALATPNYTSADGSVVEVPKTRMVGVLTKAENAVGGVPQAFSYNSLNCRWNALCPPGRFPYFSGTARTYTTDAFRIMSEAGRLMYRIWQNTFENGAHSTRARTFDYLSHEPGVQLLYQTSYNPMRNRSDYNSFVNVSYACWDSYCFSNTTNSYVLRNIGQSPVTRSISIRGELCSWTVECDNSTNWMMFWRHHGSFLSVMGADGEAIPSGRWGAPLRTHRITVTNSPFVSLDLNYQHPRFAAACIENLEGVCEEGQVYDFQDGTPRIIKVPEQPNGVYHSGMTCWYQLTCPPEWTIALRGAIRTADNNDFLRVRNGGNTSTIMTFSGAVEICTNNPLNSLLLCPQPHQRTRLFHIFDFMVQASSLLLQWETDSFGDDDGIPYDWAPLEWRCFQSRCPTNTTGDAVFEWVDEKENSTANTVSVTTGGAQCGFIVRCADPTLQLYFFNVSLVRGGTLRFFTADDVETAAMRSFQATQYNELRIEYTGALLGELNITFECYDRAKLITCGSHLPNTALSGAEGNITVPLYRGTYVNDMRCTFEITCPNEMIVGTRGGLHLFPDTDRLEFYNTDTGAYLGMMNGSKTQLESASVVRDTRYIWRHTRVTMIFISDLFDAAAGLIDFGWVCFRSTCSSNTTDGSQAFVHTVGEADLHMAPLYLNEVCDLTITCTGENNWLAFDKVTAQTNLLRFMTLAGDEIPSPNTSTMLTDVPLRAHWDPPEPLAVYSFSVGCFFNADFLDSACAPGALKQVTGPAAALTIPINPLNSWYYNNMLCMWMIECAADQLIAIRGALQTPDGDPFDHVALLDHNLGTILEGRGSWQSNKNVLFPVPFRFGEIVSNSRMHFRFASDAILAEKGFVEPVEFLCIVGRCWTNSTEPIDEVYVSPPSRLVQNRFFFETCSYRLRCHDQRLWMTFEELRNTHPYVTLFDIDRDSLPMVVANEPIAMSTLLLEYTSPPNTRHRFTARFGCIQPFGSFTACVPGNVDVKRPTIKQPRGSISIPMQPNEKYAANANCTWKVECPVANGGIHMTGEIITFNSSDALAVLDRDFSVVLQRLYSNPSMVSVAWDFFIPSGVVYVTWTTDARNGARGLVEPFMFECFRSPCFHPEAHAPMRHNGVQPPRNVTLGRSFRDECRIVLGCTHESQCLSITAAHGNTTGVAFENSAGIRIRWPRIVPGEVLPISELVLLYNQPDEQHHFWFEFACFPATHPHTCNAFSNTQRSHLWFSETAEATESSTITLTGSLTPSATTSSSMTASNTRSDGSETMSGTHELTETVQPPPTSTVTITETITPPPTPTPTFTASGTSTMSLAVTLTTSLTAELSQSISITQSVTRTESESEEASMTASASETAESTASASTTSSDSVPVLISFRIRPEVIRLSALRGEADGAPLQLTIDVLGSTVLERMESAHVFAAIAVEVVGNDGQPTRSPHGIAARLSNVFHLGGLHHSETQIFVNLTVDRSLHFSQDEFVVLRFANHVFRFHEHNVPVRPAVLHVVAHEGARSRGSLERTGSIAAAVSGLAAASPGIATHGARVSLLRNIATCQFGDDEPLDFLEYPLGLPLGPGSSEFRFYAGQAVFNPVLLFGVLMLHKLVAYAGGCFKGLVMTAADTWAYFPSYSVVPGLMLLQVSLKGAWMTLVYHDDVAVRVAASASILVVWLPFFLYCASKVGRRAASLPAHFRVEPSWGRVRQFFLGRGSWEDGAALTRYEFGFHARFGAFFACYREGRTAFLLVELGFALALSIVASVRPPDGHCNTLMVVMALLNSIFALTVTVLVPYVSMLEQLFQFLISTLEASAAICFNVGLSYEPLTAERERNMGLGEMCLGAVAVLLIAKSALDVATLLQEQWERIKDGGFSKSLKSFDSLDSKLLMAPTAAAVADGHATASSVTAGGSPVRKEVGAASSHSAKSVTSSSHSTSTRPLRGAVFERAPTVDDWITSTLGPLPLSPPPPAASARTLERAVGEPTAATQPTQVRIGSIVASHMEFQRRHREAKKTGSGTTSDSSREGDEAGSGVASDAGPAPGRPTNFSSLSSPSSSLLPSPSRAAASSDSGFSHDNEPPLHAPLRPQRRRRLRKSRCVNPLFSKTFANSDEERAAMDIL